VKPHNSHSSASKTGEINYNYEATCTRVWLGIITQPGLMFTCNSVEKQIQYKIQN